MKTLLVNTSLILGLSALLSTALRAEVIEAKELIPEPFPERKKSVRSSDDTWEAFTQLDHRWSEIKGDTATWAGGWIGWTVNDRVSIGPTAYVLYNNIDGDVEETGRLLIDNGKLWYAGLRAEYRFRPNKKLSFGVGGLVAGGTLKSSVADGSYTESNNIMVVEPSVDALLRVYPWLQLGATVSYTWVQDLHADDEALSDNDLTDFMYTVSIRMTEFW